MKNFEKEKSDDLVIGRNAVTELLKSGREVDRILVAPTDNKGSIVRIIALAREKGIVIKDTTTQKLDTLTGGASHQGVVAFAAAAAYVSVEDILQKAKESGHAPFIVICDEIEDPHNLGAILRTCEACAADGVIIPKRRNVGLTSVVAKTSAGAVEYVPVARVSNIAETIDSLKKDGIWF